jgi:hypothetical protein
MINQADRSARWLIEASDTGGVQRGAAMRVLSPPPVTAIVACRLETRAHCTSWWASPVTPTRQCCSGTSRAMPAAPSTFGIGYRQDGGGGPNKLRSGRSGIGTLWRLSCDMSASRGVRVGGLGSGEPRRPGERGALAKGRQGADAPRLPFGTATSGGERTFQPLHYGLNCFSTGWLRWASIDV